ncbi:MAG: DUF3667 domain-containing protein [Chlorobi bacterium]|nr:DUF3667 domain-containing protein [Chlorobiota bacterium]
MTQKNTNKVACPNCEKEFDSHFEYCPYCGQKNSEPDLRFKHFFFDFLSGAFNLDSKFYQTFKILLLKPAKLSKEYLAGKRTKYLTPVRIYLIVSFVYFTLLSVLPSDFVKSDEGITPAPDSVSNIISFEFSPSSDTAKTDSVSTSAIRDNYIAKKLTKKTGLFRTKEGKKIFSSLFRKYMSVGMFFLIPLTALIFYLMFRKGTYYIQHLVFVLHLQSVMFILFIFFNLVKLLINNGFVSALNFLAFLFFLLIWIKKFYQKSWGKTVWKAILFLFYFGFIFVFFMIVVAGATYWNL